MADYNNEFALPILSNFRCILKKEEKKVKVMSQEKFKKLPYLDVEVVKVEKKKKPKVDRKPNIFYVECIHCGHTTAVDIDEKKFKKYKEGSWVNGENLDKIKFPCFCRYKIKHFDLEISNIGRLDHYYDNKFKQKIYQLYSIQQGDTSNLISENTDLKKLIKNHDIHILKAKVVLFEDE